jgi:FAD/FMN-containing dehydrogenase
VARKAPDLHGLDRVIHRTFMLIVACANTTEMVFAPLACAIRADVAVRPRSGGDNTAERSEAISAAVAGPLNARRVSRAPAAMPG